MFIEGGFIVKRKDKFINHYTTKGAEMILNEIHQHTNLKEALTKAFKKEFKIEIDNLDFSK